MTKKIELKIHKTDGGAVYLTDNDMFTNSKIIIRLDGGKPELIRCDMLGNIEDYENEEDDDSFDRDWCNFCEMSCIGDSNNNCPNCGDAVNGDENE